VPYPRANPGDFTRLPIDTWGTAQIPATVRFEFVGDAESVEIEYRTTTDDLGYRGDGAGRTFSIWNSREKVDEARVSLGEGKVRLAWGREGTAVVYLPEGMKPVVLSLRGVGGSIEPAPVGPRWVAYGDSLAEGWIASEPALAWPAVAARTFGLDVVNLGYAGAARGEVVSAEHVAGLSGVDVISITHGTNCWTRVPFSAGMMREAVLAFLSVVRQGHPSVPIVVASPVIRPDAEATPNRLGATLGDLRAAMEEAAGAFDVTLIRGESVLTASHLADGIHPGDEGHRVLASVFGSAIQRAVAR
jgi:lysophospholipase L1-like esterase